MCETVPNASNGKILHRAVQCKLAQGDITFWCGSTLHITLGEAGFCQGEHECTLVLQCQLLQADSRIFHGATSINPGLVSYQLRFDSKSDADIRTADILHLIMQIPVLVL